MGTRENSIATWCKRFQIDLGKLHDRMKSGELTVYEKRADGKVDITPAAMVKLKELITQIEEFCWTNKRRSLFASVGFGRRRFLSVLSPRIANQIANQPRDTGRYWASQAGIICLEIANRRARLATERHRPT
jgi:hypothetical protein